MGEDLAAALNAIEEDSEANAEEEEEVFEDPDAPVVTKIKRWEKRIIYLFRSLTKFFVLEFMLTHLYVCLLHSCLLFVQNSFDLNNPTSLQEAIFALDYIDHDFYVFRNEESNEINVVYKRNAGGVGLIEPSQ